MELLPIETTGAATAAPVDEIDELEQDKLRPTTNYIELLRRRHMRTSLQNIPTMQLKHDSTAFTKKQIRQLSAGSAADQAGVGKISFWSAVAGFACQIAQFAFPAADRNTIRWIGEQGTQSVSGFLSNQKMAAKTMKDAELSMCQTEFQLNANKDSTQTLMQMIEKLEQTAASARRQAAASG
ncbi:MAG: hypothetical protein HY069_02215 [Chlamydiia bacterium]|nr:hypothetical protein [Chlamydiia bacterium]